MPGEHDLATLLRHMTPVVHPDVFVFCSFPDFQLPGGWAPVATFREAEGLSAIVPLRDAQAAGVGHQFESRMVTLTIHSALDAVGFLARICTALAEQGIACNAVSAYHHDHLFVPAHQIDRALQALAAISAASGD
jgi:hypothetical protein